MVVGASGSGHPVGGDRVNQAEAADFPATGLGRAGRVAAGLAGQGEWRR